MATELLELQLEELSLVDRPANAEAIVTLYKRDDIPQGDKLTMDATEYEKMTDGQKEEMDKMSDDMKSKMKVYMEEKGMSYDKAKAMCERDMKKSEVETLKAENERLRKGLIDAGYVIKADTIEKKAPAEFIEVEGEQINKADIPAPILKKLEEVGAAQKAAEIAKKAEETLPNFKPEVAQALMKFDLEEQILEALIAADKLFEAQMEEVGKADVDGDMDDPQAKLDKMVDAYAVEHELTKAQAYAKVAKTAEGKALINKTYKKD